MPYNSARNVVHCRVDTPAGFLHVLTTHGYHIKSHKHGDEHTLAACRQISEYIETLDGPVVQTGDFNLVADSDRCKYSKVSFAISRVTMACPRHVTS